MRREQVASVGYNEGKKAHLILVDGNPVRDLAALRRVDLVIKGKDLFFPRSILESQGIAPF